MPIFTNLVADPFAEALTTTIVSNTSTLVVFAMSDGGTLELTGIDFVVTSGAMTGGTINSIVHRFNGVAQDEITNAGYSAVTFQSLILDPTNLNLFLTNGIDTFNGNSGADFFFGGAGFDTLNGNGGADTIDGGIGDDAISGGIGADQLLGNDGFDFLRGDAGADTLNGGASLDFATYDDVSTTGVIINLSGQAFVAGLDTIAAGTARDGFGDTDTLISIEEVRGGANADTIIGRDLGYTFMQGRDGADTYIGGKSAAIVSDYGGLSGLFGGNDGFVYVDYRQDGGTLGVSVTLTNGTAGPPGTQVAYTGSTGGTGTDTFGNTETFIDVSAIRGSMLADEVTGNDYFNWFEGLAGADTFHGGGGTDTINYNRDQRYGGVLGITADLISGEIADGFGTLDTVTGVENVFGTNFDDTLTGNEWGNSLRGFSGNDTLIGGDGFDSLRPGLGMDLVDGTAGANGDQAFDDRDRVEYNDTGFDGTGLGVIVNLSDADVLFEGYTVTASTARKAGGAVDTLIDIERARGTAGRDYLIGSSTANLRGERFEGNQGADYIDGGAGYDTVFYETEANFFGGQLGVIANLSTGVITVAAINYAAGTARDTFGATDTLIGIEGIEGTRFADYVVGGDGHSFFRSLGGADFFDGGAGLRDQISFAANAELWGVGNQGVIVDMVAGTATTWLDGTTTTFINVEDVAGSEGNDSITGDGGDNTLTGEAGNDTLRGGDGNDRLGGSAGVDVLDGGTGTNVAFYLYDPTAAAYANLHFSYLGDTITPGAGVTVDLALGTATDQYGDVDTLISIQNVAGTFFADTLTGDANANTFHGLSGNDTIDGADGLDTLSFAEWGATDGSGVPALVGKNASRPNGVSVNLTTGVVNDSEGGTDTVTNIENVIGSVGADTITGSGLANDLKGFDGDDSITAGNGADSLDAGEGNDTLDGGAGADNLIGGGGNDLYFVDNVGDTLTELAAGGVDRVIASASLTLTATTEIERLDAAVGTVGIALSGSDIAQTLYGNAGSNVLDGKLGADTMTGFGGNDWYYVDNLGDVPLEALGGGTDRLTTSITFALRVGSEIERMDAVAGVTAINLTGNEFGQSLVGNDGANTLDGKAGADTMSGGLGNDIYIVDSLSDVVLENVGGGVDRINASLTFSLRAGQEIERLDAAAGSAISLYGNELVQSLNGNASANVLDGRGGADVMTGFGGNDIYFVDNIGDVVNEATGGGVDRLIASFNFVLRAASDIERLDATAGTVAIELTGNELGQALNGNAGANVLNGALGNDVLTGGAGLDTFAFTRALNAATNVDTVTDFSVVDDSIALENGVMTGLGATTGVLDATMFFVGTAAADASDRIIYNSATGFVSYDADGLGGVAQVAFARLTAGLAVTNADFLVI